MELVSVIIPTYNRGYCIEESIASVLAQTYSNIELIIVDDASTDDTAELVNAINDERVRYHCVDENVGPSKARNIGAKMARGKYIAFQDSDDSWDKSKLEKQMRIFNEQIDLVFCDFDYMEHGLCRTIFNGEEIEGIIKQEPLSILARRNVISVTTMVIRKEFYNAVGGFDESLRSFEDWEFVVRISDRTRFACVSECLVHVNKHINGVNDSQINATEQMKTFLKICEQSPTYAWQDENTWEVRMNVWNMLLSYLDEEQQRVAEKGFCLAMNMEEKLFSKYNARWKESNRFYYRVMMLEKLAEMETLKYIKRELEKRSCQRIALYGMGGVGKLMVDQMLSVGEKIEYIIDKHPQEYRGIEAYRIEEIPRDVDAIIMTLFDYGKIARYVEGVTGKMVIPLSEIVPW